MQGQPRFQEDERPWERGCTGDTSTLDAMNR